MTLFCRSLLSASLAASVAACASTSSESGDFDFAKGDGGRFQAPTTRQTFSPDLHFIVGSTKDPSVPVAFFDADSTLRISATGEITPVDADDVRLLPGAAAGVSAARDRGELTIIVSNQGGVSKGYTTFEIAEAALARTADLLVTQSAPTFYFDFAPEYDEFRKPGTGMAELFEEKLMETYGVAVNWEASYMVGDAGWKKDKDVEPDGTPGEDFSNSDRGFAEALGIPYNHPRDAFGWAAYGVRNFHSPEEVDEFNSQYPDFDPVSSGKAACRQTLNDCGTLCSNGWDQIDTACADECVPAECLHFQWD